MDACKPTSSNSPWTLPDRMDYLIWLNQLTAHVSSSIAPEESSTQRKLRYVLQQLAQHQALMKGTVLTKESMQAMRWMFAGGLFMARREF